MLCSNILFIHSILGCYTTSRLFGLGKASAIKKILIHQTVCKQAEIFNQTEGFEKDLIAAGKEALISLYGGSTGEGLDNLQ